MDVNIQAHRGIDPINIERAILSTFLDLNETGYNKKDVYKLDLRAFLNPFNKRVAEKINEVQDGAYGFLSYTLEESIIGTKFDQEFIWIIAQTSLDLSHSKRYHDRLLSKNTKGEIL